MAGVLLLLLVEPASTYCHYFQCNVFACFFLQAPALVSASNLGEKSSKKGLVIPSWPRHFCYDWNAFTTVRCTYTKSIFGGFLHNNFQLVVPLPHLRRCRGHQPLVINLLKTIRFCWLNQSINIVKILLLVVHLPKRSSAFRGGATRLFPLRSWDLLHTHGSYQRKS